MRVAVYESVLLSNLGQYFIAFKGTLSHFVFLISHLCVLNTQVARERKGVQGNKKFPSELKHLSGFAKRVEMIFKVKHLFCHITFLSLLIMETP